MAVEVTNNAGDGACKPPEPMRAVCVPTPAFDEDSVVQRKARVNIITRANCDDGAPRAKIQAVRQVVGRLPGPPVPAVGRILEEPELARTSDILGPTCVDAVVQQHACVLQPT